MEEFFSLKNYPPQFLAQFILYLCYLLSRYSREATPYPITILHQCGDHLAPDERILFPPNDQHTFH